MGVAAYNRGSACISRQIQAEHYRPPEFELMDMLNGLRKHEDCGRPSGPVVVIHDSRGFWSIECPRTGFGYWYCTIHELMRRWDVSLTGYDWETGAFSCTPNDAREPRGGAA